MGAEGQCRRGREKLRRKREIDRDRTRSMNGKSTKIYYK